MSECAACGKAYRYPYKPPNVDPGICEDCADTPEGLDHILPGEQANTDSLHGGTWRVRNDPARPNWPGVLLTDSKTVVPVAAGNPHNREDSAALAQWMAGALNQAYYDF